MTSKSRKAPKFSQAERVVLAREARDRLVLAAAALTYLGDHGAPPMALAHAVEALAVIVRLDGSPSAKSTAIAYLKERS